MFTSPAFERLRLKFNVTIHMDDLPILGIPGALEKSARSQQTQSPVGRSKDRPEIGMGAVLPTENRDELRQPIAVCHAIAACDVLTIVIAALTTKHRTTRCPSSSVDNPAEAAGIRGNTHRVISKGETYDLEHFATKQLKPRCCDLFAISSAARGRTTEKAEETGVRRQHEPCVVGL